MPNYCDNTVTLKHESKEKIDEAIKAFEEDKFCSHFIPIPNNPKMFGYNSEYDFRVGEWGTKWDCGADNGNLVRKNDNQVTFSFSSAWAPPVGLYKVLHELGYSVYAMYFEPGMGFAGEWDNGVDNFYEDAKDAPNHVINDMSINDAYDDAENF